MTSKEKCEKIVSILEDKKAIDIATVDLNGITVICDYFVICSGTSTTHVKALSDQLEELMKEFGPVKIEGHSSARWILHDYRDIIVHIFHPDDREHFSLEKLWSKSPSEIS